MFTQSAQPNISNSTLAVSGLLESSVLGAIRPALVMKVKSLKQILKKTTVA